MTYDNYTKDELKSLLNQNKENIDDLTRQIKNLENEQDEVYFALNQDDKRMEHLHSGWKGQKAERYINEVFESNDRFRKQFTQAFSEAREQLEQDKAQLFRNEQDIYDEIEKQNRNKEKEN